MFCAVSTRTNKFSVSLFVHSVSIRGDLRLFMAQGLLNISVFFMIVFVAAFKNTWYLMRAV